MVAVQLDDKMLLTSSYQELKLFLPDGFLVVSNAASELPGAALIELAAKAGATAIPDSGCLELVIF